MPQLFKQVQEILDFDKRFHKYVAQPHLQVID